MEEPLVEVVPKTEDVVPKTEEVVEKSAPVVEAPAAKSKGGRPAGAKDKAPRKKKIVIVAEPIAKPPPEIEKAEPPPAPVKEPVRREVQFEEPARAHEEPLSPRTILRQSANHMLELKRLNDAARKNHLQNAYTRRLAAF